MNKNLLLAVTAITLALSAPALGDVILEIAEVSLFVAIDYRDLARPSRQRRRGGGGEVRRPRARLAAQISKRYRGTEQAEVAAQLLKRLSEEAKR